MSLSISAIQTIATYYPNMRGEPRCQHALTIYINATSMDDLNAHIRRYKRRILHVTLHGGDVGRMKKNEHVDVFLTITGVTSIGKSAFNRCDEIRHVTFPSSLKDIGNYAFRYCRSLKTVDLSKTQVKAIPMYVFKWCSSLESLVFPKTLESIWGEAFGRCTSLNRVYVPASVYIDKDAFPAGVEIIRIDFTNPALRF